MFMVHVVKGKTKLTGLLCVYYYGQGLTTFFGGYSCFGCADLEQEKCN